MTTDLENLRNRHSYTSIETGAPLVFTPSDLVGVFEPTPTSKFIFVAR